MPDYNGARIEYAFKNAPVAAGSIILEEDEGFVHIEFDNGQHMIGFINDPRLHIIELDE